MNFKDKDIPRERLNEYRLFLNYDNLLFRIGVQTFYSVLTRDGTEKKSYTVYYVDIESARKSWKKYCSVGWKPAGFDHHPS